MQPDAELAVEQGAIGFGLTCRPLCSQFGGAHCQKLLPLFLAPALPRGAIGQKQLVILPIFVRPTR
jgi:hypothetical protein